MKPDVHHFWSLLALQEYICMLKDARKSYRTTRNARPKPGKWLYMVVIYDGA
jgi:hypothetical protein